MKVSLIVPCYNEEKNISKLYSDVYNCFSEYLGDEYEIIFIDDGSTDNTWHSLEMLINSTKNTCAISFSRNFGKEAAIYSGMLHSTGDMVCIMDADLQQTPENVLKMVNILDSDQELDCVALYIKHRCENRVLAGIKYLFYKLINALSDINFVTGASDFRLMRRNMVNAVLNMQEYHRFSKGIFNWVGFNTVYLPYEPEKRKYGKSKWKIKNLFKYALDGIISFSVAPLILTTFVGLFSSLLSVIYLLIVLFQKVHFGIEVPGYATIIVLILFMGGIILFSLGVIGEYISRIYIQIKNRPLYFERKYIKSKNYQG